MKNPNPFSMRSVIRIFIIASLSVFVFDFLSQIILDALPRLGSIGNILLDSVLLYIFLFPIGYFSILRPLSISIKERQNADEALREEEARFSLAFQNAPYSITISNLESGKIIEVNDAFSSLFGFPKEEATNDSSIRLKVWLHGEDRDQVLDSIHNGQKVFGQEFLFRKKNGEVFTGLYSARMIRIRNEPCIISNVTDISERKKTEEDLKKSQILLRSSIESIQGAFVSSIDKNYNYLYFNDAHRKRMKEIYDTDIEIGMNLLDCITVDDDKSSMKNRFGKALSGEYFSITKAYKDEPITYESSFNPIRNENNEVIGATGFSFDITGRIKAEEALKKSRTLLESSIEAIKGASISSIDINFNYIYFNTAHRNWMKEIYDTDVEIGKNLFDCITVEEEKSGTRINFNRAFSGESFTIIRGYENPTNAYENSFNPIRNENNEIIGATAFSLNISDRMNIEKEKRKSEEYLQQVQRLESLGVLAGGIAHDFNNILTGVFGFTDLAKSRVKDPIISNYLSHAMESMERAKGLTQQLLTFAKGGAPVKKITSLSDLVKDTTQFALSGSNVKCNCTVPQDLWYCNVDKNQIGQVIQNLMINAVQAMPLGGYIETNASNVSLREKEHPTLEKGNYVRISIKDQGTGIPEELLPRIFDPFFTTKTKGQGLGLAISYSIIQRHAGAINVESELGKGTTFQIYLPACDTADCENIKTASAGHKGTGRVLVMDDDEAVRNLVALMLQSFGYSVVCRENGKETMEFYGEEMKKGNPINAMILDLTIPGGMGGKEVAAEIRKWNRDILLFVSSGYADDPIMARPEEYGFTGSLSKPFHSVELMELLEKHMGKQAIH